VLVSMATSISAPILARELGSRAVAFALPSGESLPG
jgi:hypothetical protein